MDTFVYFALLTIVILFLLGTPLCVTFSIGSIAIMIHVMDFPVGNISQIFFTTISGYPMLAMPFSCAADRYARTASPETVLPDQSFHTEVSSATGR